MRVLLTMSCNNIMLNTIPTIYAGHIVSVHRTVMENRPADPQGQHPGESPTYILHVDTIY